MKQLFDADGVADACTFELTLGIRTAGDPETDTAYNCPDEEVGCPSTAAVACAFDNASSWKQQVQFLICWDESQDAEGCSEAAGIDFSAVSTCQSGSRVAELLKAAAIKFETKWPEHAHSGMYHTPHIVVDGEEVSGFLGGVPSYSKILQALCATPISAPACSSVVTV